MFASKKDRTVIAEGLKIVGSVTSEGLVEVYGSVEGEMHCSSLVITRKAHIVGSIRADNIVVNGTVEGPVECGAIIFNSEANVIGDVECESVVIEKGAFMQGRLRRRPTSRDQSDRVTLNKALTTPAEREREAERIALTETATRKAELVVEARHLSGNPDMPYDEALAFLARRGNPHAKLLVEAAAAAEPRANGRV